MPNWKKVIVSGSLAELNSIVNNGTISNTRITGSFTGSFTGDASGLTGVPTPSGVVFTTTNQTIAGIKTFSDNVIVSGSITASIISSSGTIIGNSFVKGGGTSAQFLKADGSVDSSTYLTSVGTINLASGVTGTLPVGNGGTGATTFTAGRVLIGNGTSAITTDSQLVWNSTNNRLGIGNTNPAHLLDLYKSTDAGGTAGTTLQRLWNYVGSDLSKQRTFIDFVFTDDNDNQYPQVRIGAEVGQNSEADSQLEEGSGAFVVYTNDANGIEPEENILAERFRVDYAGNVGIGITNPLSKLHVLDAVNRDMNTGGSGSFQIGGNGYSFGIAMGDTETALYHNSSNRALTLGTDETARLTISGTGNVGIGTTNPLSKLHVSAGTSAAVTLRIGASDSNIDKSSRVFLSEGSGGSANSSLFGFSLAYDGNGGQFGGLTANDFGILRHNNSVAGVPVLTLSRANSNATFAGTVTATQFLGDASSTSNPAFAVDKDESNTGFYYKDTNQLGITVAGNQIGYVNADGLQITKTGTTSNFSGHLQAHCFGVGTEPSTTQGEIRAAGDIIANYSSDKRLKENIKLIPSALDKLLQINGVTFDWIEKKEIHSHIGHDVGVIAQEIEAVLPEVVTTRDNGYKAVNYEKIVPLLIEAIKDLKAEINELKSSK